MIDHEHVLLISNPAWSGKETVSSTVIENLTALYEDIAYSNDVTENLTVLASRYSATENGALQGLLYVPDLDDGDPCVDYARQFVPDSAVHQSELPPTNYNLIAVAPWFNASCTKSYLASAREDPLRAFLFYIPTADSSKPPDADDDVWDLDDGGDWKSENHYPIFAISGALGSEMVYQLSLYSGNVSDAPNGNNISRLYNADSSDYIRIWTRLTVKTPTGLPNVWKFVLTVIGVVLAVILLTTLFMHASWRRRRTSLRRRVEAGEVNLESMNISRLAVPSYHVEKFPLFTYSSDPRQLPPPTTAPSSPIAVAPGSVSPTLAALQPLPPLPPSTAAITGDDSTALSSTLSAQSPGGGGNETKGYQFALARTHASSTEMVFAEAASSPVVGGLDYQPTCYICLQDFEDRVTVIRELPCGHIFHPDCIDEFLCKTSSLCPLCKASMLPRGYCPRITNAMVRRERAIRRLRARVEVADLDDESVHGRIHGWTSSIKRHIRRSTRQLPPVLGVANDAAPAHMKAIELQAQFRARRQHWCQNPAEFAEATHRRTCQLAQTVPDPEETDGPRWKVIGRKVFPGFV